MNNSTITESLEPCYYPGMEDSHLGSYRDKARPTFATAHPFVDQTEARNASALSIVI
jgi:hypothetical protein